jgi:hypothetical protein
MNNQPRGRRSQRGGALVVTAVSLTSLSVLSLSLLSVMLSSSNQQRVQREKMRAEYVCEAALQQAVLDLRIGGDGALGSQLAPQTWGGSQFWVDAAVPGPEIRTLTATAVDDRIGARIELTLARQLDALWRYGAFGDLSLIMDSNSRVDSYNSSLGTWHDQAVNGSGSDQHALLSGDIGSNGSVLMKQNSKVWGDAVCGSGSSTTILGNAVCTGSTAPSETPMALPPLVFPFAPSNTNVTVNSTLDIPAGNHAYGDFAAKSNTTINVTGPATLVFRNFQMRSGSQFLIDTTGGPVKIYVENDFTLGSNTMVRSLNYLPADVEVNLLSDNIINPEVMVDLDVVDFNSNAKMYGTIYAPNAHIEIDSNFELFGALIAKSVDLDSNCRIHYDESLALSKGGTLGDYQVVCWRSLPYTH